MGGLAQGADEKPYIIVEQMPQFKGGQERMTMWISERLEFPLKAISKGITDGVVYVGFVISEDGSVENVKIIRGVDPLLDNEAVRVISKMPKWEPGRQGGKTVRVSYTLPIHFALRKPNYVVTNSNDTLFGALSGRITAAYNDATVEVANKQGDKRSYELKELKAVKFGDKLYVVRPSKPNKSGCKTLQLMRVMMRDGDYLVVEKVVPAGYKAFVKDDQETIIANSGFSYSKVSRYLFKGDTFLSEYTKKNYTKLIDKYFQSCPRFSREVKFNRKLNFDKVEQLHNQFCTNE